MERKVLDIYRDGRRASWIRERTFKTEKQTWAGHVMSRTDNRWTAKVRVATKIL